jgi:hypothetical protein
MRPALHCDASRRSKRATRRDASSLAARSLQELGLRNATDLVGGIQAWKAAGLPIER